MSWLSRLDDIVTNLLPEEDRNPGQSHDVVTIDPLLDMDLNYGTEAYEKDQNQDRSTSWQNDAQPQVVNIIVGKEEIINSGLMVREVSEDECNDASSPKDLNVESDLKSISPENSILNDLQDLTEDKSNGTSSPENLNVESTLQPTLSEQIILDNLHDSQNHSEDPNLSDIHDSNPNTNFSIQMEDKIQDSPRQENEIQQHFDSIDDFEDMNTFPSEDVVSNGSTLEPSIIEIKTDHITKLYQPLTSSRSDQEHYPEIFRHQNSSLLAMTHSDRDMESDDIESGGLQILHNDLLNQNVHSLPPVKIHVAAQDMFDTELRYPLLDWNESDVEFHQSMNCLGVFHVRALAAQKLPCPVGSAVQLTATLQPWNGKVRAEPAIAFEHKSVCVKWDSLNDASLCSMVHAWNSNTTPIPKIKVELVFKPLKVVEFTMCSLTLSCKPLMAQPGKWKKQWCQASLPASLQKARSNKRDHTPLLLIEAAFFPAPNPDDDRERDDIDSTYESLTQAGRMEDGSSLRSTFHHRVKDKAHLLKLVSIWIPSRCAACKRSLIGWNGAYRCEACNIDCCQDCQLQIDLQVPCGSLLAKTAVDKSLRKKVSIENILTTLAPVDEKYELRLLLQENNQTLKMPASELERDMITVYESQSIGKVRINVLEACLFDAPLPMETPPKVVFDESNARNLRYGDYYVRVSCLGSDSFNRTRTIQSTYKPRFDSPEMVFDVPHYGMEYRIDVIDASNNTTLGTIIYTAQSLLQLERDRCIQRLGAFAYFPWIKWYTKSNPLLMKDILRTGFKEGFGSNYFVPYKSRIIKAPGRKPGDISGWLSLSISLDEDVEALYGLFPIKCPQRPMKKFDIEILQSLLFRISLLIEEIKTFFNFCSFVLSWENAPMTGISYIIFTRMCFYFDLEYIGSLPFIILTLYMMYFAVMRVTDRFKYRFVERETRSRANFELGKSVDRSLHRPLGRILISVAKGRHLRSRDLGLPGSVGCSIFWDPQRYCESEDEVNRLTMYDKMLMSHHDIGSTDFVYSSNPNWECLNQSLDSQHLHQMINPEVERIIDGQETKADKITLEFPLLQPFQEILDGSNFIRNIDENLSLAPWTELPGAIVVQVKFSDVVNKFPGFEDVLGEVVIPISKIIEKQEFRGWFQVLEMGSKHVVRCDENDGAESPRIFLDLRWKNPNPARNYVLADFEREASIVVAEERIRAAQRNSVKRKDIVGSSIGALSTIRGITESVQSIQNTLESNVDAIEMTRNLFNFTHPKYSTLFFLIMISVLFIVSWIPTRILVFGFGTNLFGFSFWSKFAPLLKKETKISKSRKKAKDSFISNWILNFFHSIPTDDDLQKAYFWESARMSELGSSTVIMERRKNRLEQIWKAKWYSAVKVKVDNQRRTSSQIRSWHWENRFLVIHGRRLLLWSSETDFDEGEPPLDRILLSGHAGLAGLSPLEIRDLSPQEEFPLVVNVFGRSNSGQLKVMILVPSYDSKEALEETILSAAFKED
jgi:C2 domain